MLPYSFLNLEPISCSTQGSNCCFLTHIQASQEAGKMIWYSHLSESLPQFVMIHTVKDFSVVDETEIDVFLKFPCFLYNPANVGNLISSSSSFPKPRLDICKFLVHIMLKPRMKDFKHDLTVMCRVLLFCWKRVFAMTHTVKGFSVVNECFSGIALPSLWPSKCSQFDLWFLCLF